MARKNNEYKKSELWDNGSACLESTQQFHLSKAERGSWWSLEYHGRAERERVENRGGLMSRLQSRESM